MNLKFIKIFFTSKNHLNSLKQKWKLHTAKRTLQPSPFTILRISSWERISRSLSKPIDKSLDLESTGRMNGLTFTFMIFLRTEKAHGGLSMTMLTMEGLLLGLPPRGSTGTILRK